MTACTRRSRQFRRGGGGGSCAIAAIFPGRPLVRVRGVRNASLPAGSARPCVPIQGAMDGSCRRAQIPKDTGEGTMKRASPADEDVIDARPSLAGQHQGGCRLEPPANAVAHHRLAGASGDREANADSGVGAGPARSLRRHVACGLKHETGTRHPQTGTLDRKILAAPLQRAQSDGLAMLTIPHAFHQRLSRIAHPCRDAGFLPSCARCRTRRPPAPRRRRTTRMGRRLRLYALRRLRPLARRALMIRRPALVAIRARKPCRRLRTSRLG